jgi:hypothetical protein
MSASSDDTIDLRMMFSQAQENARELRLVRIQLAHLNGTLPSRLTELEQAFHAVADELSRGFGQMQQQLTRNEKRLDAVDRGLSEILAAIKSMPTP